MCVSGWTREVEILFEGGMVLQGCHGILDSSAHALAVSFALCRSNVLSKLTGVSVTCPVLTDRRSLK